MITTVREPLFNYINQIKKSVIHVKRYFIEKTIGDRLQKKFMGTLKTDVLYVGRAHSQKSMMDRSSHKTGVSVFVEIQ